MARVTPRGRPAERSLCDRRRRTYEPGDRLPPFPTPAAKLQCGPIWERVQIEAYSRVLGRSRREENPMVVLVADQLSEDARELLRGSELGYLDRRGALWLRRPDLIVNDTSLMPLDRQRQRPDGPIRGRVALGVALRRLMHPVTQESVREIAGAIGASPSTVHDALAQAEGLLRKDRHSPHMAR